MRSRANTSARCWSTSSGEPLKASSLKPLTNYVFHYPFVATPVFLLDLGKPATPQIAEHARSETAIPWPGGVGPQRSIVAYSAICAHKLVYPTRDVSFISFRKTRAQSGVQDGLIHCCAEHSQYDPARGAAGAVGPGAAAAVRRAADARSARPTRSTAYATLGGELFDDFFRSTRRS